MPEPMASRRNAGSAGKIAGTAGAFLGLAALFMARYYPNQKMALWVLAVGAAAGLVAFFFLERHWFSRVPGSRAARHGTNAAAITLAFLGILVLLNVLAARHNKKWDATAQKLYTLSDQTLKVLRGLKKDVTATAFYADAGGDRDAMKRLLDGYKDETPHLRVTFVDPDRTPELARRYAIREYGTTVFESGDQSYRVTQATEEAATNALVRVTREGRKSVYFVSGHGEHSLGDTQRSGYSSAKRVLEDQGYAVKELLLVRDAEVPKDCDILVLAGATKPYLDQEREAVKTYLDRGGKVLLLVDPMTQTGLEPLLDSWGVVLHDDVVIDTMSRLFGGSYTTPILTEYPPHDITKDFKLATFLPMARSVDRAQTLPPGVTYAPVARTSPQSWGETDLKNDKAAFDPAKDHKGPLTAAALFEKKEVLSPEGGKASAQLLVVGDSDFADNTYFSFSGNGDLFQNMVSYLAKEEDLISIRPKDSKGTPLTLTRSQAATLFYASVIVAPLFLIAAGVGIWWRRKNL